MGLTRKDETYLASHVPPSSKTLKRLVRLQTSEVADVLVLPVQERKAALDDLMLNMWCPDPELFLAIKGSLPLPVEPDNQ